MDSNKTVIDRVGQLMTDMQQKVDEGVISLSAKEWEALDRSLQSVPQLLEMAPVNERLLEQAAAKVVKALDYNTTLGNYEYFAKRLKDLMRLINFPILSCKPINLQPKSQEPLLRNQMITLSFVEWVKQKIQGNNRTAQGR